MNISATILKVIGVVLALVGLALLVGSVGLHLLPVHAGSLAVEIVIGLVFLVVGYCLVTGQGVSL